MGDGLKTHLMSILNKADKDLHEYFPASKIIFCPLVGTDLARVVSEHQVSKEDQIAVEEAIWEFNSQVFAISKRRGNFTPPLHHQVHRFCKGTRRAYYHHLMDGIHLSDYLKLQWAQNFIKAMARN